MYSGKIVTDGATLREHLIAGVDTIANPVGSTLGPSGSTVMIQEPGATPTVTKDGVTVAKSIFVKNPVQQLAIALIRDASARTCDDAGDGTTTSTVLAQAIVHRCFSEIGGTNGVKIQRQIQTALKDVVAKLIELAIPVDGEDAVQTVRNIATVAANNDAELGRIIADAVLSVGRDGVVAAEYSRSYETQFEMSQGLTIPYGLANEMCYTNFEKEYAELDKSVPVIVNIDELTMPDFENIAKYANSNGGRVVIVAPSFPEAIHIRMADYMSQGLRFMPIVIRGTQADLVKELIYDIATVVGAKVSGKSVGAEFRPGANAQGIQLANGEVYMVADYIGRVDRIRASKHSTLIVGGDAKIDSIEARANEIKDKIASAKTEYEKNDLSKRLARITGGVGVIRIGARTATEGGEIRDRVEDAIHATKDAIAMGILPGGGSALMWVANDMGNFTEMTAGAAILQDAIRAPFHRICGNCGVDVNSLKAPTQYGYGYNLIDPENIELVNMFEAGIVDPLKVTINALQNAVSAAGNIVSAAAAVTLDYDSPDDTSRIPVVR